MQYARLGLFLVYTHHFKESSVGPFKEILVELYQEDLF